MTGPLHREIAAAILIGDCGRYLLQQRDDIPGIIFPGMIGLFGGHMEPGETPLQCVRREIHEETGQDLADERFEPLVEYATRYPDGASVQGSFYVVREVPTDALKITEGQLLPATREELNSLMPKMTPAVCFVLKTLLEMDKGRD